jgi:O-antigen/teichoic acid export membrane protein
LIFFVPGDLETLVSWYLGAALMVSLGAAAASVALYLRYPRDDGTGGSVKENSADLYHLAAPLGVAAIVQWSIVYVPAFFIGYWNKAGDVALFSAAQRTAALLSFLLVTVNAVLAPRFSEIHARGDQAGLENMSRDATSVVASIGLALMVGVVLFSGDIMAIFGPSFGDGGAVLVLLAAGQAVVAATGPVGILLAMCNEQHALRNSLLAFAPVYFAGLWFATAEYGIYGAAVSTLLYQVSLRSWLTFMVYRKLGLMTIPIFPRGIK